MRTVESGYVSFLVLCIITNVSGILNWVFLLLSLKTTKLKSKDQHFHLGLFPHTPFPQVSSSLPFFIIYLTPSLVHTCLCTVLFLQGHIQPG